MSGIKNAIVTGAGRNSGIGAEVCRMLARKGINIYFTSYDHYDRTVGGISEEDYKITLTECKIYGVTTFFKTYDLSKSREVKNLFDDAEYKIGKIDILINCACYHIQDELSSISEELLDINYAINAKATMMLSQEFYLRFTGKSGRIINFSSTQSLESLTTEIAYAISKASVPIIVSTLAPIMANKNITINAVNPGATDVGDSNDCYMEEYLVRNKFHRLGLPSDSANLVGFLISEEGQWITGQVINSEGCLCRGVC